MTVIYTCKPKKIRFYHNTGGKSPEAILAETGCDVVLNGVLFNGNGSLCDVQKIDGKVLATSKDTYWGYGWNSNDAVPTVVPSSTMGQYDNFMSCLCAIANGEPQTVNDNASGTGGTRGRTAIGLTVTNKIVILCTSDSNGPMRLSAARDMLIAHGCVSGIILDGGGSCYLNCPAGKVDTTWARKTANRTYICIWEEKPMKKYKICIDPGHGLGESSNGSPDGTYKEHEFTLDLGKRIKVHLIRCGIDVLMTREDGTTPSLTTRAQKANNWGADLFVSIHSNAVGNSGWDDKVRGLTVWTYDPGGERDRAAKLLLAEMKAAGVQTFGTELYHSHFTVLAKSDMPAYLVEYAFHTAREDVKLLKSAEHRDNLAEATAKAICAWCGVPYVKEAEPVGDSVYKVQVGAFTQKANAEALKAELKGKGYTPFIVEVEK